MAKKVHSDRNLIDVNEVIDKVLALTRGETAVWDVTVHTELRAGLPCVTADRVQLQQVTKPDNERYRSSCSESERPPKIGNQYEAAVRRRRPRFR
jgi:hypothetical protein